MYRLYFKCEEQDLKKNIHKDSSLWVPAFNGKNTCFIFKSDFNQKDFSSLFVVRKVFLTKNLD